MTEKGVPIRSVSRSLSVLEFVNRVGPAGMLEIARGCDIPYATACRVVQTLVHEGMLEREDLSKRYRPGSRALALSAGFADNSRLSAAAREPIVALTREILWPVLVTSRVGNVMLVRDATSHLTSLSFHTYRPGHALPLTTSASGKAYLAFTEAAERATVLEGLAMTEDIDPADLEALRHELDQARLCGYALSRRSAFTAAPGKISSVAVPIGSDAGLQGALALVFFAAACPPGEIIDRHLAALTATAAAIANAIGAPA